MQALEDAPPTLEQQLQDGQRLLQDADVLIAELTERVRQPLAGLKPQSSLNLVGWLASPNFQGCENCFCYEKG